jgi:putative holliday junction resolvase
MTSTFLNKRAIALDIGSKTVGIAKTDPTGIIVEPYDVLRYQSFEDTRIFQPLTQVILDLEPITIVSGLPINMDDSEGSQSKKVRNFIARFKKHFKANGHSIDKYEWVFWDERLSTAYAEEFLIEQDVSRAKRKKVIDKMAAFYILSSYLEENS